MKKRFQLPFEARACSLLAYSDEQLEHGFFAYKVQFPHLRNPETFALESRLTWSVGLGSLYRYSEPIEPHVHSSQAFFELPDECREVIVEPVVWKKSGPTNPSFNFDLIAYGQWSSSNVVTILGEEVHD